MESDWAGGFRTTLARAAFLNIQEVKRKAAPVQTLDLFTGLNPTPPTSPKSVLPK